MTTKLEKNTPVNAFKLSAMQRAFVREIKSYAGMMDAVEAQQGKIKAQARSIKARTPEGMAAVGLGVLEVYSGKCVVTPQLGLQFSVGTAQAWYERHILPLLPRARKAKGSGKAKRLSAAERAEKEAKACDNSILRLARRIRLARDEQGLTPKQIKEAIKLGLGRGEL